MSEINALEHYLFRDYSITIKKWLQDNVYLHRYPKNNNINVVYGTPDRAWAEFIYPVVNSGTLRPNINFHLTEMEYTEGENFLGFVKEYKNYKGRNIAVSPPLIYKLTYSLTFFARTQSELDIMFYQMLTKTHKNKKAAFMVDGQWAELWSSSPTYETQMEPPSSEDIVRRGSLKLIIERAYLPLEVEDYNVINSVDIEYVINNINTGV